MQIVRTGAAEKGLDGLTIQQGDEAATPRDQEIRVKLHASSLNYHDYGVVSGRAKVAEGRIPMSDGAGEVVAVGDGVKGLVPGDKVVSVFFPDWQAGPPEVSDFSGTPGDGIDGYAREEVTCPASWFTKAPAGWTHAESATITTAGLTAWRALVVEGGLKAGDTVLLLGTGGVSVYALQIAKAMGARVAITSSSDDKLAKAREMGADFTLNYKSEPQWGEKIVAWTKGKGVDLVVEVGGPGTLAQSVEACRTGGSIVLIGVLTGMAGDVPTALLMRKQIRLTGIIVGNHQHQRDFVRALEALNIKPVIDKHFRLANIAEAFRYEESGAHFGKIVLDIG